MIYRVLTINDSFIDPKCDQCGEPMINGEEVFMSISTAEFFCYTCREKKSDEIRGAMQ